MREIWEFEKVVSYFMVEGDSVLLSGRTVEIMPLLSGASGRNPDRSPRSIMTLSRHSGNTEYRVDAQYLGSFASRLLHAPEGIVGRRESDVSKVAVRRECAGSLRCLDGLFVSASDQLDS